MENKKSKCVTSFSKSHGTQYSLIVMLERWKKFLDKEENISALFMDMSKAFDTINHGLLLAKTKGIYFLTTRIKFYVWLPEKQKTKSSNQQ